MVSSDTQQNITLEKCKLYRRRWFWLLIICLLNLIYSFSGLAITQINNIFVDYFHITYTVVDWGTIASRPGSLLASLIIAWLTQNRYIEFRYLAIAEAAILAVSFVSRMAAFASSSLFGLVILGQFLNGVCGALAFPLCLSLATAWFPYEELGTCIGVFIFGGSLGLVLGVLVPSHLMIQPSTNLITNNETWKVFDRNACLIMWSVPLFISLTALVIIICFASDHPPTPPTLVQEREQSNHHQKKTFAEFLSTCKKLLLNKNYMTAVVGGAMLYYVHACEYTMMTQVIRNIIHNNQIDLNPDVISSYSAALLASGGLFGAIAGGKLVDNFKNTKALLTCGSLLAVLSTACITISYHFDSYKAIFAFNLMFGFSIRVYLVSLLEIIPQITYPTNAAFVGVVFDGMRSLIAVTGVEIARLIFNSTGGLWMLIFQTICAFLGMLITLAIKSENKRIEAEQVLSENKIHGISTESTHLLDE